MNTERLAAVERLTATYERNLLCLLSIPAGTITYELMSNKLDIHWRILSIAIDSLRESMD